MFMFTQRCLFLSSEHNSFHFSWRFHTHTYTFEYAPTYPRAHKMNMSHMQKCILAFIPLAPLCLLKAMFLFAAFLWGFYFQHQQQTTLFSPLSILFTECSDANSSNKSWRVALFKVSHSKRSVQTLHNTFSLFPTALSKCTNAFHFI